MKARPAFAFLTNKTFLGKKKEKEGKVRKTRRQDDLLNSAQFYRT